MYFRDIGAGLLDGLKLGLPVLGLMVCFYAVGYVSDHPELLEYLTIKMAFNIALPVMSCTTSLFISSKLENRRLLGYWLGLLNQPLWYYLAWSTTNYGIAVNAMFYTCCWIKGIYGHTEFFQKNPDWYMRLVPHKHEFVTRASFENDSYEVCLVCRRCPKQIRFTRSKT